jgi:hypothetical protein
MTPHLQNTPYTTAASALLSIIKYLKPQTTTKHLEFQIWQQSANLPTRGSNIFALATYAKDLNPTVIVENENYNFPDYRFFRYTKEDIELAAFTSNLHLKKAKDNNINIITKQISFQDILHNLTNHAILLRVNAKPIRNTKKNTSQYIAILEHNQNQISIFDPTIGGLTIPITTLKEAFESLETKKHRDHKMILFKK